MVLNKNLLAVALTSSLLVVAGCSSGDDPNTGSERTGQAIDGYLTNAKVCLDVNLNSKCDDSEPNGQTRTKGQFTIAHSSQFANVPALVRPIEGKTVDTDTPNETISELTLTAPASAKVVTPLTTLVQSDAEDRLASDDSVSVTDAVAAAKKAVQNELGAGSEGIDVLNDDYVAAQQDEDSAKATAARKVSATARSVNEILNRARGKVDGKVGDNVKTNLGDKADAAINKVAITKVRSKLSNISSQVNNDVDSGKDVDQLVSDVSDANEVADSELNNVVNEVTQAKDQLEKVEDKLIPDDTDDTDDTDDPTGATGGSGS